MHAGNVLYIERERHSGTHALSGALEFLFGMMLTGFTYPVYTMASNDISYPGNFNHPVPAVIFNVCTIVSGAMAIYATGFARTTPGQ